MSIFDLSLNGQTYTIVHHDSVEEYAERVAKYLRSPDPEVQTLKLDKQKGELIVHWGRVVTAQVLPHPAYQVGTFS